MNLIVTKLINIALVALAVTFITKRVWKKGIVSFIKMEAIFFLAVWFIPFNFWDWRNFLIVGLITLAIQLHDNELLQSVPKHPEKENHE